MKFTIYSQSNIYISFLSQNIHVKFMNIEWFKRLGWSSNPFTLVVSPKLFIGYKEQREAALRHINEKQKVCLITGPTGSGKTTMLLWLEAEFLNHHTLYITKPPKQPEEFLPIFLEKFPLNIFERLMRKSPSLYTLSEYVNKKLRGKPLLILLDEAHETNKDVLEWLRVLVDQIEDVSLIIAGLPRLEYQIKEKLETLEQRITTRITLDHLTEEETRELIRKRIEWVGGEGIKPFTEEAIMLIHEKTNGFPREILKFCDRLIHKAMEEGAEEIDDQFVRDYSEFKERKPDEIKVSFEPQPRVDIKDLPFKQRRVLEILSKHDWLTPTQIAEEIGLERYKSQHHAIRSINNILKRLLIEGYVQRESKGKAFVYALTPKTRAYFVEA
jgi:type II secretory pathway predicted ATPase ExeA